jgi:hypothetical protein
VKFDEKLFPIFFIFGSHPSKRLMFLWALTCTEDIIVTEQYCATYIVLSESVLFLDCNGSDCTETGRTRETDIDVCLQVCRDDTNCEYISFTMGSSDGECLQYDACPTSRQYGDGQQGTITQRACNDCKNSFDHSELVIIVLSLFFFCSPCLA